MDPNLLKIAFSLIKGIGPRTAIKILQHFGEVTAFFNCSTRELQSIPEVHTHIITKIKKQLKEDHIFIKAKEHQDFCLRNNIQLFFLGDENYPSSLSHCYDPPILLYWKGQGTLESHRSISVVGTRAPSRQGLHFCKKLVKELIEYDASIISGLAYGIDQTAHQCALDNDGSTIAVLAHGLQTIYPNTHKKLAQDMLPKGGILSEFPPGIYPDRENFPKRNRIIAGLSHATLVIESKEKGGSMITAELANGYHKDVFALPGRISDQKSSGCNLLIKEQRAILVNSAHEIASTLGWNTITPSKTSSAQNELYTSLNLFENQIIQLLLEESKDINSISISLQMPTSQLSVELLNLEFKGLVRSLPGKRYEICR